ncbi:MAG: hypothetical protein HY276_08335 [Ignavibacteriales bacterium]|nr:hypothetical protein [Ignavibacteriales bacterium]
MDSSYQPISCSVYDVLEVAALRKKRLRLLISGKPQEIIVYDVYAKGKEEFLDGVDPNDGSALHIRLDAIDSLFDSSENKTYAPKQC